MINNSTFSWNSFNFITQVHLWISWSSIFKAFHRSPGTHFFDGNIHLLPIFGEYLQSNICTGKVVYFDFFQMGYAAGYGLAITSWVQMAVMCYTGQNAVDRVNILCFPFDFVSNVFTCYLPNVPNRMIISWKRTTTSNGTFCQPMIKNMFSAWFIVCKTASI